VVDKGDSMVISEAEKKDSFTLVDEDNKKKTIQMERRRRSERLKREIHITTQENIEAMAKKRCLGGNPNKSHTLNDVNNDQL
jgi:serine protease inhibitor ecotin